MFVVVTCEVMHRMPSCRRSMLMHFSLTIIMACHASAYLKNQRISTQIRDNHLDRVEKVSAHPVHFVHKADPGHSILVSLHTHTQSWLHHTQARFDRGGRADVLNMPS